MAITITMTDKPLGGWSIHESRLPTFLPMREGTRASQGGLFWKGSEGRRKGDPRENGRS